MKQSYIENVLLIVHNALGVLIWYLSQLSWQYPTGSILQTASCGSIQSCSDATCWVMQGVALAGRCSRRMVQHGFTTI